MKIKKPFDLEKAKNGAEVVTRDLLPYKFLHVIKNNDYIVPVVGVLNFGTNEEEILSHTYSGTIYVNGKEHHDDLFILEEPKQVWTNVYKTPGGFITLGNWHSKEIAEHNIKITYIGPSGEEELMPYIYIKSMLLHEE